MLSVVLFSLSVLLASVSGWGSCEPVNENWETLKGYGCDTDNPSTHTCYNGDVNAGSTANPWYNNKRCNGSSKICVQESSPTFIRCTAYIGGWSECNYIGYVCTTQAEADSVKCVLNPSLPGCQTTQDTTIYY